MDEPHRRRLIEHYLQAYNRFDIDGMLAVLAHNVRFENHSGGRMTLATEGVDAFGELARQSAQMFSEREQRLLSLVFDGNQATAEIGWRGVFAQDIPDGPRAGAVLELQGQSAFLFVGDRIARIVDRS
ncbi:TPA: nuclear transport factor 2 family protein [Stenotrophomonas maltophilia]|nr:nuclear transport factor 2 family protein [Stenotrophomonas maltophilia]